MPVSKRYDHAVGIFVTGTEACSGIRDISEISRRD